MLAALSRRPPRWANLPAAVAGSISPPTTGNRALRPSSVAGPVGLTDTPRCVSAATVPLFRVSLVWPSSSDTWADAAGAAASAAALAASRTMVRFTGKPPDRGTADCSRYGRGAAHGWRAGASWRNRAHRL